MKKIKPKYYVICKFNLFSVCAKYVSNTQNTQCSCVHVYLDR